MITIISFSPVSSKKLHIQIYNQILSQIQSGSFQVGDKLPAERELCEQFGVSRAPIRQALSALELNGMIYSRQGEGVFVKSNQIASDTSQTAIFFDSSLIPNHLPEKSFNWMMEFSLMAGMVSESRLKKNPLKLVFSNMPKGVFMLALFTSQFTRTSAL